MIRDCALSKRGVHNWKPCYDNDELAFCEECGSLAQVVEATKHTESKITGASNADYDKPVKAMDWKGRVWDVNHKYIDDPEQVRVIEDEDAPPKQMFFFKKDQVMQSTWDALVERYTSITGGQKEKKLARFDLIPVEALTGLAEIYGKGAIKYEEHNWRRGYPWSLSYAAAQRHMNAFWNGEEIDPESGQPHVLHAAFHMFTLFIFTSEQEDYDDRYARAPLHREAESGFTQGHFDFDGMAQGNSTDEALQEG